MHNNSITQEVLTLWIQDTARQQVERVLDFVDDNGVASIGASVEPGAHVVVLGKDVYEFAFAFVSPLRSENDCKFGLCSVNTSGTEVPLENLGKHNLN